jgi:hypothetical protein
MQKFDWKDFRPVDIDELVLVKNQYHQAIQSVAAVGRKFLPDIKNDQNALLAWVPGHTRLAGQWVKGSQIFRSSISFEDFSIYLVDNKVNVIAKFELEGKTQSQMLIWLEEQIGKLGLDAAGLTMRLPYKIPEFDTQYGAPFTADLKLARELGKYFHNTFVAIRDLSLSFEVKKPEIHVWPHRFDICSKIILKDSGSEDTNTVLQVGLCPGDEEYSQPYFYVKTWPHVDTSNFEKLQNGALWHEDEWTGAVLMIKNVMIERNQKEIVDYFFNTTVTKLAQVLTA